MFLQSSDSIQSAAKVPNLLDAALSNIQSRDRCIQSSVSIKRSRHCMFCPVQGDPSGPGDPDALGSRFEMQVIGIFSLLFHNLHPVSGFLNHHSLETWKIIQESYRIMTINISWCDFNGCSGSRYWVNATLPDVLRFGVVDQWRWLKPQGDTSNQPKVGC